MSETTCPCCKGLRGRWQHFDGIEPPTPRWEKCLCCDGTGEVTGIKRATLLARGDIAPVQLRGSA